MKAQGFQPQEHFVQSIVQLNEILSNRHGGMIVGPSMSGKTTALRILEETYNYRQKQELVRKKADFVARKEAVVEEHRYVPEKVDDYQTAE